MKRSVDRILTTHVGRLIRLPELLDAAAAVKAGSQDSRRYEDSLLVGRRT
jgi:hypothetical protein